MARPVRFAKSHWPNRLIVLWFCCQLVVSWYWPTHWPLALAVVALAAQAWLAALLWQACKAPTGWIYCSADGRCRVGDISGHWTAECRWCWAGFWLCWQDVQQQQHRCWLFADALSDDHRRALARQLSLSVPAAKSATVAWFS